jgi:hypothetical protein
VANLPFNTLYDQVVPYLPGAEPGIIDSNIRKALREFMKRSAMFREEFVFNTTPGVHAYQLTPTQFQVASLLSAYAPSISTRALDVATEEMQTLNYRGPLRWYAIVPDVINLIPAPDDAIEIRANAILTLKQADTTYPEELLHHHGEAIAAGVLSIMMGMPGKPWTKTESAKQYGRVFNSEIKSVRARVRDGGQPNHSTFIAARSFGA